MDPTCRLDVFIKGSAERLCACCGSALVEGDSTAAVGAEIAVDGTEIVDGSGFVVIPGFVDAHMHTWQTALRGAVAGSTLIEYFRLVQAGLATR